jgi:hypothetical protein
MLGPRLAHRLLSKSPLGLCRGLASLLGSDGVTEPVSLEYEPVCDDVSGLVGTQDVLDVQ